ncbi:MAG: polyprenyl diphosphate synthase [Planctomycetota bacterium]
MPDKQNKFPSHVAIIMDGNGRWANKRNMQRVEGHRKGTETVRDIIRAANEFGIKELTLYAFSEENWKRPSFEVSFLMELLKQHLIEQREETKRLNIKLSGIGRLQKLPKSVLKELRITEEISRNNTGMHARLALSYGGRQEILDAFQKFLKECDTTKKLNVPTEKQFRKYLYDPSISDPDLLIRTGGEMRVSNFLLWEISYSEIYITPVLWPDFSHKDLEKALKNYGQRERRFGGVV